MKKLITFAALFSLNTMAIAAEDGTGQGHNQSSGDSSLDKYCSMIIKAEDGTGQNKDAEDGTGQNKSSAEYVKCMKYLNLK